MTSVVSFSLRIIKQARKNKQARKIRQRRRVGKSVL
jgi:hypothetical protein